jgi:hypothetical protein
VWGLSKAPKRWMKATDREGYSGRGLGAPSDISKNVRTNGGGGDDAPPAHARSFYKLTSSAALSAW